MNLSQANAALLLVDLLTGARTFSQEKVVDALQLLADGAGKKLMTTRRPVEVRDAAVRLHELAALAVQWAVRSEDGIEARPGWTENEARDWAAVDADEHPNVVMRRFASDWVVA